MHQGAQGMHRCGESTNRCNVNINKAFVSSVDRYTTAQLGIDAFQLLFIHRPNRID